ncbi:TPA: hypothetical protein DCY43_02895 [candidate division WWE3 bacterium]|uniref:TraG P-loop domain-containing protein n=2 Tax=Katanobacteria TaxID=422282 RepID=A0A1F4V2S3_UNCKA|nr:MAG: hypothetical protein A2709_01535 [candidate division WWE3 bacterium RIFCSPHIGHO2_01_FULL_43_9]HAZ29670.1 hypothetical protein [candidate division WWE3 bacterium]
MPELIKASTQEHLDIEDIRDDYVVLKTGGVVAVIQTTAVNFDLLSEIEQDAMIGAFAMLLNSLTFPIQVLVRSKRLDISKYIDLVYKVEQQQKDPLLKFQAEAYRKFVQDLIQTNDVLDKKFYVAIPSALTTAKELGSSPLDPIWRLFGMHKRQTSVNVEQALKRANNELPPKIDHVIKEFNRIGVKSKRLGTQELVELFFDIYNPSSIHGQRVRTNVSDYKTAIVQPAILEE